MRCILFILITVISRNTGLAQKIRTPSERHQSLIRFTENKHQWPSNISHKAQLDGGALFIEKNGNLTYHLYDKDNYRLRHIGKSLAQKLKLHAYTVTFVGANTSPQMMPSGITEDYVNYYIGNDPSKWATHVPRYNTLTVNDLYPHIDVVYTGGQQSIKYNFIVKPHGKIEQIKLQYNGIDKLKLKHNELYIETSVSESIEHRPYVYQMIHEDTINIPCKFVLENNTISFKLLKQYDPKYELIIDPLLVFAASSGSTADNFGMTATYDARGNLYAGGTAFDVGYPTTIGAYDVDYNGGALSRFTDVVITKYDSSGTLLKYSTYLGGATASEIVTSLMVDKHDNLCLYGATGSSDFPTTAGCYDNTFKRGTPINFVFNGTVFNDGTDIYVAKFNTTGSSLLASTYIGGTENDGINYNNAVATYITPFGTVTEYPPDSLQYNYGDQYRGEIQVDSLDNIYVFSSTKSSNFPTQNAIDNTLGGKQDAVLIKFNPGLTNLIFSTYIGGSDNDAGYAIAFDDTLNMYITGGTRSGDFPVTSGSYKTLYSGGKCDGYVCKIKANGSGILHASYIGTNDYDQSYFVQLDRQQNVYLFGQSLGNMPVTSGVYTNNNSKQFIQKLNPQLNSLMASTVFGNSNGRINISPSAFSVDCAGNIYLSGWGGNIIFLTPTNGMPVTSNAIQNFTDGFNFYLMVLAPSMSNLLFGSYFGGNRSQEHVDGGTSRFDKKGIIYQSVCAGCGGNDDFPVTPGAWPNTGANVNHSSNCNNGVFKIDFQLNTAVANISASALSGCVPLTVNFNNTSTPGHAYIWDFGNNDTTSMVFNPVRTYTATGTYTVHLYVKTSICDDVYDTARVVINVYPNPEAKFMSVIDSCSNKISFINQTHPSATPSKWYMNSSLVSTSLNTSYAFNTAGTYTVKLSTRTSFGCKDSVTKTIVVPVDSININPPVSKCFNESVNLSASGGTSYTWSPTLGLSDPYTSNPICKVQNTTVYTVTITQNSLLGKTCSKTMTTSVTVYPKITSAFTYTIGACSNNVSFSDASYISPTVWQWHFGDGNASGNQNPVYFFSNPGAYSVALIATNAFGCKDTSQQTVNVSGFNPVSVNAPVSKCERDTVQLNATGGVRYVWHPGASLSDSTIQNPLAFPKSTTSYTVNISTLKGADTCKSNLTTTVTIHPFSYNTSSISVSPYTITLGQSSTITLNGFPYTGTLSVSPGIPITTINNQTYLITPNRTGDYTLSFTDANGCFHLFKTIFVEVQTNACDDGVVYLPTGFTPNNDGVNDILYVRSNFITELYLTIYDRWGEKLFETNDLKKGWNGTYKGKQLDQGVYGYYLTFKCNNGEESFKKGNITLMR